MDDHDFCYYTKFPKETLGTYSFTTTIFWSCSINEDINLKWWLILPITCYEFFFPLSYVFNGSKIIPFKKSLSAHSLNFPS